MKKLIFLGLMLFIFGSICGKDKDYIYKVGVPIDISSQMTVIEVEFIDFHGNNSLGMLVVNKKVAKELEKIFKEIKNSGFQIEKIVPISEYGWDDDKSMEDNNSSAYNYRFVVNSKKLSNHSYGMAIDINPLYNPMIIKDKRYPKNGVYSKENIGTITPDSPVVKIFKKYGWKWGGDYKSLKDYQHFEKNQD